MYQYRCPVLPGTVLSSCKRECYDCSICDIYVAVRGPNGKSGKLGFQGATGPNIVGATGPTGSSAVPGPGVKIWGNQTLIYDPDDGSGDSTFIPPLPPITPSNNTITFLESPQVDHTSQFTRSSSITFSPFFTISTFSSSGTYLFEATLNVRAGRVLVSNEFNTLTDKLTMQFQIIRQRGTVKTVIGTNIFTLTPNSRNVFSKILAIDNIIASDLVFINLLYTSYSAVDFYMLPNGLIFGQPSLKATLLLNTI